MDFSGKRVLITGAARGIGLEIARQFGERGAELVITDYDRDGGGKAEEELKKSGFKAGFIPADVSDETQVSDMFKKVAEGGKLDILVNNAGIIIDKLLVRINESDWDKVIDINLKGTFLCLREASKLMLKAKSGKIVNISSMVALGGNPGQANYTASKAGVIALTKTAARELGPRGINVNSVAPGFIQTEMTANLPKANTDMYLAAMSIKRPGTPADVANAVMFLASDEASYITGQTLVVDGGYWM
ncbi:MAG: 3-oxoacyl-[acyl-carrier-protein] reductase [candidate division Zixibacteria bacterium]|nr:3-oxoacyl-[acyl-carrier-protein] reductase [candidate division Zixibacteria bacterium]